MTPQRAAGYNGKCASKRQSPYGYHDLFAAVSSGHSRRFVVRLFQQFSQATRAGEYRAPTHLTRFAATNNRRLFTRAAESGPTAGHRAFARCRRLLTKFGDLIRIEHRHQHLEFRLHRIEPRISCKTRVNWCKMYVTSCDKALYFQRPILCLKSRFSASPT